MKALSFSQPWLWAMTELEPPLRKEVENRSWLPPSALVGQRFALHAAKSWDQEGADRIEDELYLAGVSVPPRVTLPAGAIVGSARLSHVVASADPLPDAQRRWFFGPVGLVLTDVELIEPVPCRGMLGFWEVPADVASLVMAARPRVP